MKNFLNCLVLYHFIVLAGCAAALVPETSDPTTKINQAIDLVKVQGRPVGAITLVKQAVDLSKQQKDKKSEAIAEFYIAETYKSPGSRGRKLLDISEAFKHYDNGIKAYSDLKFYKWSAFLYWNKSQAYKMMKKSKESCTALLQAKAKYQTPRASSKDILPFPYSGDNLINGILKSLKDDSCEQEG